jgi:trk system potassium uptake protein TrkA
VTRFGAGMLPTAQTVFQAGDLVHVLATDDVVPTVSNVAGSTPEGEA